MYLTGKETWKNQVAWQVSNLWTTYAMHLWYLQAFSFNSSETV